MEFCGFSIKIIWLTGWKTWMWLMPHGERVIPRKVLCDMLPVWSDFRITRSKSSSFGRESFTNECTQSNFSFQTLYIGGGMIYLLPLYERRKDEKQDQCTVQTTETKQSIMPVNNIFIFPSPTQPSLPQPYVTSKILQIKESNQTKRTNDSYQSTYWEWASSCNTFVHSKCLISEYIS